MQAQDKGNDNTAKNGIAKFKQQLGQKSNQELSQVVNQLESVKKAALEQKISNELDTIKESLSLESDNEASTTTQDKNANDSIDENQALENGQNEDTSNKQE